MESRRTEQPKANWSGLFACNLDCHIWRYRTEYREYAVAISIGRRRGSRRARIDVVEQTFWYGGESNRKYRLKYLGIFEFLREDVRASWQG